MENVADALKMAAGVLVFVMALGIAISSFSEAKQTADVLIQYNDREYSTQYAQDTGNTNRIVGVETIIPTIYRAYKEKYKIVFYNEDGTPLNLFEQYDNTINDTTNGGYVPVNYIDLEQQLPFATDRLKDNFIMVLLYGNDAILKDLNYSDDTGYNKNDFITEINANSKPPLFRFDRLNPSGIYDIIEGETFREEFGVYYQEDVRNTSTDADNNSGTEIDGDYETEVPEADKNKARVITYTKVNNNP